MRVSGVVEEAEVRSWKDAGHSTPDGSGLESHGSRGGGIARDDTSGGGGIEGSSRHSFDIGGGNNAGAGTNAYNSTGSNSRKRDKPRVGSGGSNGSKTKRKRSASEAVSPFSPQADEEEEATPPPGAVAGAGEAAGISAHGDFPSPGDPREDSPAGSRRPPKFRLPGSKLESMDENGPVTLTAVPRRTRTGKECKPMRSLCAKLLASPACLGTVVLLSLTPVHCCSLTLVRLNGVFVLAHFVVMSLRTMFLCTTKSFTCLIA
ncbi:unnamed protein product [Closterium sp. NIES-54]